MMKVLTVGSIRVVVHSDIIRSIPSVSYSKRV